MADNKQLAADVLAAVGGKENVTKVIHCMTRLRFNLADDTIPNDDCIPLDDDYETVVEEVFPEVTIIVHGDIITVEPWRSAAFPVIKDCMVNRNAFDQIIAAGGYNTIRTGQAQDANAILIPKENADEAMDAASCIGCGCCVAACKNGSAMLFVSSKVSQLALLPQGRPEAAKRAKNMVMKMEELGFGNCTNTRACEAECPKNESISNIARLNREFIKAKLND